MNKTSLSETRRKATDIFSFVLVWCPDFPPETKTTTAREFNELTELVQEVMDGTCSDDAKQWLRTCLQDLAQSRKNYENGDRKQGSYLIQRAEEHFRNAFAKTQTTARFVIGESGPALDENNGFPQ